MTEDGFRQSFILLTGYMNELTAEISKKRSSIFKKAAKRRALRITKPAKNDQRPK